VDHASLPDYFNVGMDQRGSLDVDPGGGGRYARGQDSRVHGHDIFESTVCALRSDGVGSWVESVSGVLVGRDAAL